MDEGEKMTSPLSGVVTPSLHLLKDSRHAQREASRQATSKQVSGVGGQTKWRPNVVANLRVKVTGGVKGLRVLHILLAWGDCVRALVGRALLRRHALSPRPKIRTQKQDDDVKTLHRTLPRGLQHHHNDGYS